MKKILLLILLLMLTMRTAFAENIPVLTGVIASSNVERITAPYAGEVISLLFREGDAVTAGMEAATMSPNIVRAPSSGTVTLFASRGDNAADILQLYGAGLDRARRLLPCYCVDPDRQLPAEKSAGSSRRNSLPVLHG